jgi:hypothetical protein
LLKPADGPLDLVATEEAAVPVDDDVDALGLPLDNDLHSFDEMAYDDPPVRGRRGRCPPERGDV